MIRAACMCGLLAVMTLVGCKNNNKKNIVMQHKQNVVTEKDSTVYGVCGTGTAMNTLELIADNGDTVSYSLEYADMEEAVEGGLSVGDRMAVVASGMIDDMPKATKVINLTSLLGKWSSLSESFEICEGGVVKSEVKEPKTYTEWSICNGKLLLSADTFEINSIGPDSMFLEKGGSVYGFRRMPGRNNGKNI